MTCHWRAVCLEKGKHGSGGGSRKRTSNGTSPDCLPYDLEDRGLNEQALVSGARLFSVYRLSDEVTVWVITNGDDEEGCRDATTVLLPAEY